MRASRSESHYRAIYLRESTVREFIIRVVEKYGLGMEARERVKRAVRVTRGTAVLLQDGDVAGMENEIELLVGVRSVGNENWEWQLEVVY